MKAVYALISTMLVASLAWAGHGGEIRACNRCEVEEQYQAPLQQRESQRDEMRFEVDLDRNRPYYPPELGVESSEYDYYGIREGEPGEAPSRHDIEGMPRLPELGTVPRTSDVEEMLVAPLPVREFTSSSYDYWPPPFERMIPDAESDAFWPDRAWVLPPVEFDGSNQPSKWAKELPQVVKDGGLPPLEIEHPPVIAR